MTDDRDRRAALDWLKSMGFKSNDNRSEMVDDLAALLTAARAEGAAEAIEAAARVADTQAKHNLGMALDNPPDKEWCLDRALTAQVIRDAIRALAPAGLVAVSVDSLKAALDIIDAAISESGNLSDGLTPDEADSIRPLRAAVARKEE